MYHGGKGILSHDPCAPISADRDHYVNHAATAKYLSPNDIYLPIRRNTKDEKLYFHPLKCQFEELCRHLAVENSSFKNRGQHYASKAQLSHFK
jgi:hypothetical protein